MSPELFIQKHELFCLLNSKTLQIAEIDYPGLVIIEKFPYSRTNCYLFDFVCLLVLGHLENNHSTLTDQIAIEHRVAGT